LLNDMLRRTSANNMIYIYYSGLPCYCRACITCIFEKRLWIILPATFSVLLSSLSWNHKYCTQR
jgi:hypothetical protein